MADDKDMSTLDALAGGGRRASKKIAHNCVHSMFPVGDNFLRLLFDLCFEYEVFHKKNTKTLGTESLCG